MKMCLIDLALFNDIQTYHSNFFEAGMHIIFPQIILYGKAYETRQIIQMSKNVNKDH